MHPAIRCGPQVGFSIDGRTKGEPLAELAIHPLMTDLPPAFPPVQQARALIEALSVRRIRGAALDVVETEPLPADSPLWALDNVLLTPHCADRTKEFQVCRQVESPQLVIGPFSL